MRTNINTMISVKKSDSEWTASAIIAALCPRIPATNLNTSSTMFTMPPNSVTLYISLFLSIFLRPELLHSCILHGSLTLRTRLHVPYPDMIAATLQAQTPHLTSIGWSHIGNNPAYNDVLNSLAVRTCHSRNLLPEQSASFVHISLIAACLTPIFPFPCHTFLSDIRGR